jgi:hypothetical protein
MPMKKSGGAMFYRVVSFTHWAPKKLMNPNAPKHASMKPRLHGTIGTVSGLYGWRVKGSKSGTRSLRPLLPENLGANIATSQGRRAVSAGDRLLGRAFFP